MKWYGFSSLDSVEYFNTFWKTFNFFSSKNLLQVFKKGVAISIPPTFLCACIHTPFVSFCSLYYLQPSKGLSGEHLTDVWFFFVFSLTNLPNLKFWVHQKDWIWKTPLYKRLCPILSTHKVLALGIVKFLVFLTVFWTFCKISQVANLRNRKFWVQWR